MMQQLPDISIEDAREVLHRDKPHSIELHRPRDGGKVYWTIKLYFENPTPFEVATVLQIDEELKRQFWG